MTDHELADELLRRANAREGDSIVSLLRAAAEAIKRLLGKSRSTPQHRRYFALIKAAFKHWPESHDIQFGSAEGLRDYLQAQCWVRDGSQNHQRQSSLVLGRTSFNCLQQDEPGRIPATINQG